MNRSRRTLALALLALALLGCGAASTDAPETPQTLLDRGRILREREDFAAADAALTDALERVDATTPDGRDLLSEIYLERGVTRERLERPEEAEADYTSALEQDPQLARALNNRAAVRAGGGRLEEALADWDAALLADPGDRLALSNRALARQEAGDFAGALEDAANWERLAPGEYGPAYRKGSILAARGEADAAAEAFDEAIRRAAAAPPEVDRTPFAAAFREKAAALRSLGRPLDAAAAWDEAVRRDPRLATTPEAAATAALAATLNALKGKGFAPADAPAPDGFDLLVKRDDGDPVPVLLAEPAADGAFVLSGEQLRRLEAAPTAWIAVPTGAGSSEGGARLHRAADALRRGPRPVRFLIPGEDPPPPSVGPAPAPLPTPAPLPEPTAG